MYVDQFLKQEEEEGNCWTYAGVSLPSSSPAFGHITQTEGTDN